MPDHLIIHLTQLKNSEGLPVPHYQTEHSAGVDLYAAVDGEVVLDAGKWKLIPTGIAVAIPEGHEGQVRPRSGLALKHGIGMLNAPGTIDADYRGEIGIILFNFSEKPFTIKRGDRIAQLVFAQDRESEVRHGGHPCRDRARRRRVRAHGDMIDKFNVQLRGVFI